MIPGAFTYTPPAPRQSGYKNNGAKTFGNLGIGITMPCTENAGLVTAPNRNSFQFDFSLSKLVNYGQDVFKTHKL